MLAQVLVSPASGRPLIRMRATAGEFVAMWQGSEPVGVGDQLDVELDVSHPQAWDDVRLNAATRPSFEVLAGDAVLVTGRVVEVDHSGVMVIEVGGSLVSFDMEGTPPTQVVGQLVSLLLRDLEVHPTGV
jgi:hypothetical protein